MAHPKRHGSIVVGAYPDLVMHHLPKVIQPFRDRYPGVRISLRARPHEQLMRLVKSGEVDLALCSRPPPQDPSLTFLELFQYNMVLIAPRGHPGPESLSRQVVERAMKDEGVDCEVVLALDNTESIKRYVETGMGLGICADFTLQPEDHNRLGAVSLDHLFPSSAIGICTLKRKRLGSALHNFIDGLYALLSVASSPGIAGNGSNPQRGYPDRGCRTRLVPTHATGPEPRPADSWLRAGLIR